MVQFVARLMHQGRSRVSFWCISMQKSCTTNFCQDRKEYLTKAQCASTNQYGVCCHMTRSTVPDDATTWFRAPFIRDGGISPIASVVLRTRHEKTCRVHCCSSDIHDKSWKQVQGLWCGADTPLCSFHDDALVSDVAREFAPISSFHSRKKHALRFQLSVLNGRTMKFYGTCFF